MQVSQQASRRVSLALVAVPLLLAALLLAACDARGANVSGTPTASPFVIWTMVPTATSTLPTPTNVPSGWQVHAARYFTIAYPAGWTVEPTTHATSSADTYAVSWAFYSPDRRQYLAVLEQDHLSAAEMQQDCTAGDRTPKTMAGLPMLYALYNGDNLNYWFDSTGSSTGGVVYNFQASVNDPSDPNIAFYESVWNTFRPVYTTSACK
jgi:hypothetical protein